MTEENERARRVRRNIETIVNRCVAMALQGYAVKTNVVAIGLLLRLNKSLGLNRIEKADNHG